MLTAVLYHLNQEASVGKKKGSGSSSVFPSHHKLLNADDFSP